MYLILAKLGSVGPLFVQSTILVQSISTNGWFAIKFKASKFGDLRAFHLVSPAGNNFSLSNTLAHVKMFTHTKKLENYNVASAFTSAASARLVLISKC